MLYSLLRNSNSLEKVLNKYVVNFLIMFHQCLALLWK